MCDTLDEHPAMPAIFCDTTAGRCIRLLRRPVLSAAPRHPRGILRGYLEALAGGL
jgi:hypothetical protein